MDTIYVNNVDKVLYGISEDESIDVTDKFMSYLIENKKIDPDININKLLTDPYPNAFKKIIIIMKDDKKIILNEQHSKLYKSNEQIKNLCVIIHLGNIKMIDEIMSYLANFKEIKFDLYITIHDIHKRNTNLTKTITKKHPNANIIFMDNIGFDIGPFFYVLREIYKQNIKYDVFIKIHTKTDDTERKNLIRACMGSHKIIKNNLQLISKDNVGMIGAQKHYVHPRTTPCQNYYHLSKLSQKFYNEEFDYSKLHYIYGTMFWIKASIIYDLINNNMLDWLIKNLNDKNTYDVNWMQINNITDVGNLLWTTYKQGCRDGMFEHGFERFFGYMVIKHGYILVHNKQTEITPVTLYYGQQDKIN